MSTTKIVSIALIIIAIIAIIAFLIWQNKKDKKDMHPNALTPSEQLELDKNTKAKSYDRLVN